MPTSSPNSTVDMSLDGASDGSMLVALIIKPRAHPRLVPSIWKIPMTYQMKVLLVSIIDYIIREVHLCAVLTHVEALDKIIVYILSQET